jgi:hypothetical protein
VPVEVAHKHLIMGMESAPPGGTDGRWQATDARLLSEVSGRVGQLMPNTDSLPLAFRFHASITSTFAQKL